MTLPFFKYHGTGNDFVLVNGIKYPDALHISEEQVEKICDRHFGIGADGMLVLDRSGVADFRMIYYNSDGRLSTMCGNGGRCLAMFAHREGVCGSTMTFEAVDGLHGARVLRDELIELGMIDVSGFRKLSDDSYEIQTGSPHYVHFLNTIDDKHIVEFGRSIRYSELYKSEGINVNTVSWSEGKLHVRTYERGVEDETLSCGTGVTAAALCATDYYSLAHSEIGIIAKGGNLKINFSREGHSFTNVRLTGPAVEVFTGLINL